MKETAYHVFSDEEALGYSDVSQLIADYNALMTRLHHPQFKTSTETFIDHLKAPSELLVFIQKDDQLIACAQGSLARLHGRQYVYINDLVVHDDYEGQGYGRILMSSLMFYAWEKWGQPDIPTHFILTNSPQKENAGFYEKLGFRARTEENDDPTTVWVKDL